MNTRRGLELAAGGCLLSALLAGVLAEVLGRAMGLGALGPGKQANNHVAITFDDGPSPRTPQLLDVLAKHGVQATFFVTEPACRAYPAELAAIRVAGHGLEAHGRWHTHALLLPPWREWAQVAWHPRQQEGRQQRAHPQSVEGPYLYRPPYGGHSPWTRLFARLQRRDVALWDTEGRDWSAAGAAELAAQTLQRLRPGSVLLLHDGPGVTPELLERVLAGLPERGLYGVALADLPPSRIAWRDGLRRLWQSYGG